jgi:hypothetical protein
LQPSAPPEAPESESKSAIARRYTILAGYWTIKIENIGGLQRLSKAIE